jgi:DNA polymerase elongation subunit (family B)
MKPKILVIDIETAPASGYIWKLFDVNVSLSQLIDTSKVICFAAKWVGDKKVIFHSNQEDTHKKMIKKAWDLFNEADAVIGYNSKNFDCKILNKEFILSGFPPPAPYKHIDLLQTMKNKFKFMSNKLDHVSQELGIGKKTSHQGFELWQACMNNDSKAWKLMKKYNINDVKLTEELYDKVKGWLKTTFNFNEHSESMVCPKSGSHNVTKNGTYKSPTRAYQKYVCNDCFAHSKSNIKIPNRKTDTLRPIAA